MNALRTAPATDYRVSPLVETRFSGRRVVVVGSAPGVALPSPTPHDALCAANGGTAVVERAHRAVDVLVTTAYLFREGASRAEIVTREAMRALHGGCKTLYVDTQNGPASLVARALDPWYYEVIHAVPPGVRSAVVEMAVGEPLRVSTGVWCACLAAVSGAASVVVCGVSLEKGHDDMPWDKAPRDHIEEDRRALKRLIEMGVEWRIGAVE